MANFYGTDRDDGITLSDFVNYFGGDGNDLLAGNATPNQIYGGPGNDV